MGTFCQQETESDLQSGKGNSRVNIMFNVSIKENNLYWNLDGFVLRSSIIYSISILNRFQHKNTDC